LCHFMVSDAEFKMDYLNRAGAMTFSRACGAMGRRGCDLH